MNAWWFSQLDVSHVTKTIVCVSQMKKKIIIWQAKDFRLVYAEETKHTQIKIGWIWIPFPTVFIGSKNFNFSWKYVICMKTGFCVVLGMCACVYTVQWFWSRRFQIKIWHGAHNTMVRSKCVHSLFIIFWLVSFLYYHWLGYQTTMRIGCVCDYDSKPWIAYENVRYSYIILRLFVDLLLFYHLSTKTIVYTFPLHF
jgi:hypothetical protein